MNTLTKRLVLATLMTVVATVATVAQDVQGNNGQPPRREGQRPRREQYVIPTDVEILTKQKDGTVVVNTSALCKDVKGYKDLTPVSITIKKNTVANIEILRNNEGPRYLEMVKALLPKWIGQKVNKAQAVQVDAVTGATFTSKAVIENVQRGLKYYQEKK